MKNFRLVTYTVGMMLSLSLGGCNVADLATTDLDPSLSAVRTATLGDLAGQRVPGKTFSEWKAFLIADAEAAGQTEAEIDVINTFTETSQLVWYDNDGNELGPIYIDPKTNSIVQPTRDGDTSNDLGIYYNPKGVAPGCVPNCDGVQQSLADVAPELVAKHLASYTGSGKIDVDFNGSDSSDYSAVTTDTLTANFDNGTIGGKSVHKESGGSTGETVTIQLYDGVIQGQNFAGDMVVVDNPGGSVLGNNYGDFNGAFNADGSGAKGTGYGQIAGTSLTPGADDWNARYGLKFNVTETK